MVKALRFWLKKRSGLPDLVIIPIKYRLSPKPSYVEKMIACRESAKGTSKIMLVSKKLLRKVGGFDNIGFGEDRLLQKKIFSLLKIGKEIRKRFSI